ncbi:MAG: tetratricopeptide repeat protein [Thermodesulfobacteriota bacterium]|nr:tetratricopeptide repeat protein [Thermodesulfobacteriota bacterium]
MKRVTVAAIFILVPAFLAACGSQRQVVTPQHQALSAAGNTMQQAIATYNRGCYRAALKEFYRAHELYTLNDNLKGIAMCMNNMGNIYRKMNAHTDAIAFFDKAFELNQQISNTSGALQALANKAAVVIADNRLEEAGAMLDKAVAMLPPKAPIPVPILNNRGILYAKQGKTDAAEAILHTALSQTAPDDLALKATVNASLGNLMAETGRHAEALAFFTAAYEADKQQGANRNMAEDLSSMASACMAIGTDRKAVEYLERSINIFALTGDVVRAHKEYERLVSLAETIRYDISITSHFVKKWLKGDMIRTYCR